MGPHVLILFVSSVGERALSLCCMLRPWSFLAQVYFVFVLSFVPLEQAFTSETKVQVARGDGFRPCREPLMTCTVIHNMVR